MHILSFCTHSHLLWKLAHISTLITHAFSCICHTRAFQIVRTHYFTDNPPKKTFAQVDPSHLTIHKQSPIPCSWTIPIDHLGQEVVLDWSIGSLLHSQAKQIHLVVFSPLDNKATLLVSLITSETTLVSRLMNWVVFFFYCRNGNAQRRELHKQAPWVQ